MSRWGLGVGSLSRSDISEGGGQGLIFRAPGGHFHGSVLRDCPGLGGGQTLGDRGRSLACLSNGTYYTNLGIRKTNKQVL